MATPSDRLRDWTTRANTLEKALAERGPKAGAKYRRRKRVMVAGKWTWQYEYAEPKGKKAKRPSPFEWLRSKLRLRFKGVVSDIQAGLRAALAKIESRRKRAEARAAGRKPPEAKPKAKPTKPRAKPKPVKSLAQLEQDRAKLEADIQAATFRDKSNLDEYRKMLAKLSDLKAQIVEAQGTLDMPPKLAVVVKPEAPTPKPDKKPPVPRPIPGIPRTPLKVAPRPKAEAPPEPPAKPKAEVEATDTDVRPTQDVKTTPSGTVKVKVPSGKWGSRRHSWAKVVSGMVADTTAKGGYAFEGRMVDRGSTLDLPPGSLLLTADADWERRAGKKVRVMEGNLHLVETDGAIRSIATEKGKGWADRMRAFVHAHLGRAEVTAEPPGEPALPPPSPEPTEVNLTPADLPPATAEPAPQAETIKHPTAEADLPPLPPAPDRPKGKTVLQWGQAKRLRDARAKFTQEWCSTDPSDEAGLQRLTFLGELVRMFDLAISKLEIGQWNNALAAVGTERFITWARGLTAQTYGIEGEDPPNQEVFNKITDYTRQRSQLRAEIEAMVQKATDHLTDRVAVLSAEKNDLIIAGDKAEAKRRQKAIDLAHHKIEDMERLLASDDDSDWSQAKNIAVPALPKGEKPTATAPDEKPDGWERMPKDRPERQAEDAEPPVAVERIAGPNEPAEPVPARTDAETEVIATPDEPADGEQKVVDGRRYQYNRGSHAWEITKPRSSTDRDADAEARSQLLMARLKATKPFGSRPGWGSVTRRKRNNMAIALADKILAADRAPTEAERDTLRGYSGWGGDTFMAEDKEKASLTEYYTPAKVTTLVWEMLRDLGLQPGHRVLEPSCGAGAFLETAPEGVAVEGVELKQHGYNVAQALHGKHPQHRLWHAPDGFERWAADDGRKFDFVVGNPPFGLRGRNVRWDKTELKDLEDYFIDTSLDKLKGGGYVAFLMPASWMSGKGAQAVAMRKRLLSKGEFVSAHRMTEKTFAASQSHLGADIVIFRKRPQSVANALRNADDKLLQQSGAWARGSERWGWDKETGAWGNIYHPSTVDTFVDGTFFEARSDAVHGEQYEPSGRFAESKTKVRGELTDEHLLEIYQGETVDGQAIHYHDLLDACDAAQRKVVERDALRDPYEYRQVGDVYTDPDGRRWVLMPDGSYELPEKAAREINVRSAPSCLSPAIALAQEVAELTKAMQAGDRLVVKGLQEKLRPKLETFINDFGIPWELKELHRNTKKHRELHQLLAVVQGNGTFSTLMTREPLPSRAMSEIDRQNPVEVAKELCRRVRSISPEEHAEIWKGGDEKAAKAFLVSHQEFAQERNGQWVHRADYVTGDLYEKLDDLTRQRKMAAGDRAMLAKLDLQEGWLHATMEDTHRPLESVHLSLLDGWLPPPVIVDWLKDVLETDGAASSDDIASIGLIVKNGVYKITGIDIEEYDHLRALEKWWNRGALKHLGKTQKAHVDSLNDRFRRWLPGSSHADAMEDRYNRTYNSWRDRSYSTEMPATDLFNPLTLAQAAANWKRKADKAAAEVQAVPNKEDRLAAESRFKHYQRWLDSTRARISNEGPDALALKLHPHQAQGVHWALEQGRGIMALGTGLGKTWAALVLAAQLRQRKERPGSTVVSVPKSVLANWREEQELVLPDAKVQIIGMSPKAKGGGWRDDTASERRHKWTEVAQGDFDMVLCSHESVNMLEMTPENEAKYAADDFWEKRKDTIDDLLFDRFGAKRQQSIKAELKEERAKETAEEAKHYARREGEVYFDELGISTLIVDEGQAYKNLWDPATGGGGRGTKKPAFMGGSAEAIRSKSMMRKCRMINESNDNKGVYMLTATPVRNSPIELYTMLDYCAPDAFTHRGIRNHQDFIDRFIDLEDQEMLDSRGNLVTRPAVVGFKNGSEMRQIISRVIQRKTGEEVGLKMPKPKVKNHAVDATPTQREYITRVRSWLRNFVEHGGDGSTPMADEPEGLKRHYFTYLDLLEKASIDLDMAERGHPDFWKKSPKMVEVANNVGAVYKAGDSGQIVFCDKLESHGKLKRHFVMQGIPESQIAIMNGRTAKTADERQALAKRFRSGEIRVIIGNTRVMGEGVNLQDNTSDIHHVDIGWEPGTLEQRNGRGVRQGNRLERVDIHYYMTKAALDSYRYQMVSGKGEWLAQMWAATETTKGLDSGWSREELMVLGAEDEEEAEQFLAELRQRASVRALGMRIEESVKHWRDLQDAKQGFAVLADKNTKRARTLKLRIDSLKQRLKDNKAFGYRHLLDIDQPVMLDHRTGNHLVEGTQFDCGGQRFVVDRLNAREGMATVHQFGRPSDTRHFTENHLLKGAFPPSEGYDLQEISVSKEAYKPADEVAKIAESPRAPADFRYLDPQSVAGQGEVIREKLQKVADRAPWSSGGYWSGGVWQSRKVYDAAGWAVTDGKTIRILSADKPIREGDTILLPTPGIQAKMHAAIDQAIKDHVAAEFEAAKTKFDDPKQAALAAATGLDFRAEKDLPLDIRLMQDATRAMFGRGAPVLTAFDRYAKQKRKTSKALRGPTPFAVGVYGTLVARALRRFAVGATETVR